MSKHTRIYLISLVTVVCIFFCLTVKDAGAARVTGEDSVVPTTEEGKSVAPEIQPQMKERTSRQPAPPPSRTARPAARPGVPQSAKTAPVTPFAKPPVEQVKKSSPPGESAGKNDGKTVSEGSSKEGQFVTIDFDDVDIRVFIKFMSELAGKNFVVDRAVKGNVTIVSPRKISVKEAYKVFESVLEVHGYTAVDAGDITKIIPVKDAREKSVETRLKEGSITPEDRVVTQIISLKYANPNEMKKVLTPLVSRESVILSYPPTGMMVVTDVLSNIQRLLTIIDALDIEGIEEQIAVIPLKYAAAEDITKSMNQIFQKTAKDQKGSIEPPVKIVADERTNSLIAVASENDTERIRQLLKLLDREIPRGEDKIRVYRLQNADAEELTKVLMNLPSKQDEKTAEKGMAPVVSKDVNVVSDKSTNSLIITADRDDYLVLEDVIRKLDIPRPMVFIEALIMEVNVNRDFDLGVEWTAGDYLSSDGRTKVFGGAFKSGGIIPKPDSTGVINFPQGFSLGVLGETIKIGDLFFPNLGAIFQAFERDQDVHILSTPQIMTLDNEEAEIHVGENIPYQTRSETSSALVDYSSYEYKDVGVTLRLTPQISQERFVRLNIYQELTKVVTSGESVAFRPTTLKRTAKTAVTIKDNNTIVIGGLIGDDVTNTKYQVPCLGNIPYLGNLFRYRSERKEKRNLFIFITPHIVENPLEAKSIYDEKKISIDTMEEGIIKSNRKGK
ncbi:MAG: type II secretion system secretin GspD [Syntrophales bacterium]|nr:type II secretion system secretin GspD [Syntrophales bacterium]MDY0045382.1 type II secretion system secretin GspD [Syntrophales bacterium]